MSTAILHHLSRSKHFPNPYKDIKKVEGLEGFWASSNVLYSMAEFGRDQRQLAVDALVFDISITRKVIRALVKRQAWTRNDVTEAQPGKFHHEHRQLTINGQRIPDHSVTILKNLSQKWGGTKEKVTYYGSYDITPDVVSLIFDLSQKDKTILQEKVENQDTKKLITIKESARQGIQWVHDRIMYGPTLTPHNDIVEKFLEKSNLKQFAPKYHHHVLRNLDWANQKISSVRQQFHIPLVPNPKRVKLLEFLRTNLQGITYQGWMDGGTSLIHTSFGMEGILADHTKPIATIEMQASSIDALEKASFLFPKKEKHFRKLADEVRRNVIDYFWMKEKNYFAMGLDRNKKGKLRKIETLSANVGEILNSTFFDTLLESEKEKYITAIVRMLFSKEFLTPAGIRTRAKSQAYLTDLSENKDQPNSPVDYWDYQGSETAWIVQTGRIAEGLRRQGLYSLADQLDNRILNTVSLTGYNLEYVYVGARGDRENIVAYKTIPMSNIKRNIPKSLIIYATNIPEATQTWTASRVATILYRRFHEKINPQTKINTWQYSLEQAIIETLTKNDLHVSVLSTQEITSMRKIAQEFVIDQKQGHILEDRIKSLSANFYTTH